MTKTIDLKVYPRDVNEIHQIMESEFYQGCRIKNIEIDPPTSEFTVLTVTVYAPANHT